MFLSNAIGHGNRSPRTELNPLQTNIFRDSDDRVLFHRAGARHAFKQDMSTLITTDSQQLTSSGIDPRENAQGLEMDEHDHFRRMRCLPPLRLDVQNKSTYRLSVALLTPLQP